MKNRIVIDPEVLSGLASQLKTLSSSLQDCQQRVNGIHLTADTGANVSLHSSTKLDFTGYQMRAQNVRQQLESTKTALNKISSETADLAKAVNKARDTFEENEREIVGLFDGTGSPTDADWKTGGGPNSISGLKPGLSGFHVEGSVALGEGKGLFSWAASIGGEPEEEVESKIHLFNYKAKEKLHKMDDIWRKHTENGKEVTGDDAIDADPFEGRFALASLGTTKKWSSSVLSFDYSNTSTDGKLKTEVSVDVGKRETELRYEAGLYSTIVGKDGKEHRVLSPGAEGHLGTSFSVLETEVSSEYELIDGISVKSKTTVAVGKVAAAGDFKVGIIDGQPAIYGSVSAEALAFEAKQKFSADVLGMEASGEVGVTFGVGVHGEVGYHDGVLVVDVGAAMGLGVTIKGEIDVGGLVENVVDGLVKSSDTIANTVENVVDGTAKFVDNVGKGAKKIVSGACKSILNLF